MTGGLELKPIARTPYRFNILRIGAVVLDFLPDAVDMDRHRGGLSDRIKAPDAVKKRIFAENNIGIGGEKDQQVKFLIGQHGLLFIDVNAPGIFIDIEISNGDIIVRRTFSLCRQTIVAGDVRMDACDKLRGAEGLDDIVVRADAKATDLIDILFFCRNHQNWNILFPADAAADFKAIHAGEHQVEKD